MVSSKLVIINPCINYSRSIRTFWSHLNTRSSSDWSASRYMKFEEDRTRPSKDLLAQVPLKSPTRIVDLGCGPANSTALLTRRYPDSKVSGMDSSPNMLEQARKRLPNVDFELGELQTYSPKGKIDLYFSNAVLHWLISEERIPAITRLLESQPSGGCFAFQMPLVANEPCHTAMTRTAQDERWKHVIKGRKPSAEPLPTSRELNNAFAPLCSKVDIWYTYYEHRMESHQAIVEWFKSSGLRPFLDELDETRQAQFLEKYYNYIKDGYPVLDDGSVLLKFPRQFVVLTKR